MAGDALHTHGAVTDAKEARLAQAGLLAVQGPTILDARTGVLHGIGSTALVTGTSTTGTMTVSVAPHVAYTSRGAANGPYLGPSLEAAQLVNIAAAPGSNSRIDVVWSKQQDATAGVPSPDGTTAPLISVTTGTAAASPTKPAIPVGAEELGTVTVAAGATNTLHANVTIANTARPTVARGARIPVRNATERDALTKYVGLEVERLDSGDVEAVNVAGTAWVTRSRPLQSWTDVTLNASNFRVYTEGSTYAPTVQYRREGDRIWFRGYMECYVNASALGAISGAGALPAPQYPQSLWPPVELSTNSPIRVEVTTAGTLRTFRAITAPLFFDMTNLSYPVA